MGLARDQRSADLGAHLQKECQSFRGRGTNGGSRSGRARLGTTLCRPPGVARGTGTEPCGSRAKLVGGDTANTGAQSWRGQLRRLRWWWSRRVPSLAPGQRSPSPDLLDGRHHLLDVILGPAPGLGPYGPAGHAGGAGAGAEPAAGPPPVRRAQARRQARAPRSRPAVPPGVGRALSRPQRLRESPPRFLPPCPAPARPRSGPVARAARAQAWKPGRPRPDPGPPPRSAWTRSAPCPPSRAGVGYCSAAGRARQG